VAHLGAASPGVVFDLDRLTRVLKERYIDTQRDMLGGLQIIKGFAATHAFLCDTLLQYTDKYNNATEDEQRDVALEAGRELIDTALPWAEIMKAKTLDGY
jgi:hypothetical protein